MPVLPLPPGSAPLSGGDVPVSQDQDILKEFPREMQKDDAPVRDNLISGQTSMFLKFQDRASYSADQSNPDRATGIYLEGLCEDRGTIKAEGESDDSLRARTFAVPGLVTPTAIIAAVAAITSQASPKQPQYLESIQDGWYITNGTGNYSAYVGTGPEYPDRLYPYDANSNGGPFRPNSDPGGVWIFGDLIGRYFVIRIPNLAVADSLIPYVIDTDPSEFFVSGTNANNAEAFVYANPDTSAELYSAVVSTVDRLKGHGVRFQIYVDPLL